MNFSEYEVLVVLAEELNMRKAADRLFISQPALSQRLQTIERNWNIKIFLRSQRGLTLTPAGEKIIALAKEIVTSTNRVKDELEQSEGKIYGTLKLAAASIIAQHWLPDVLKDFTATYPRVKISLITGWTSEMMTAMYESDVHVAIVRGRPEWSGMLRRLFTEQLFLVDKEIQRLEDVFITERPFIQFKSDSTYHQQIQYWWYERYRTFPQRTIVVDQIETCKQLAYAGIGYAILPEIAIKEIGNDMIKIPLTDQKGQLMTRDTWLIGSELSFQLPQVQAFIRIIDKHTA
ncbi:MAG TPA: LysR family transcriptional regulator [Anoxybacillus sp.]|nr:LysR family transcriptional regulator [Anoxybacillus sp.]